MISRYNDSILTVNEQLFETNQVDKKMISFRKQQDAVIVSHCVCFTSKGLFPGIRTCKNTRDLNSLIPD